MFDARKFADQWPGDLSKNADLLDALEQAYHVGRLESGHAKEAELYRHMQGVAEANGFSSITAAIAAAVDRGSKLGTADETIAKQADEISAQDGRLDEHWAAVESLKKLIAGLESENKALLGRLDHSTTLLKRVWELDVMTEGGRLHTDLTRAIEAFVIGAAARAVETRCPACNGNDANTPCAYPSEGKPGCLRDKRLAGEDRPAAPISARPPIAPDADGDCQRCGLGWSIEEIEGQDTHECPPGFVVENQRTIPNE